MDERTFEMSSFGRIRALPNFYGLKKKIIIALLCIIIVLLCSPYVNTASSDPVHPQE